MTKQMTFDEIAAIRSAFAGWADDILLTEAETAAVISLSRPWLKLQRQKTNGGRGPRFVTIAGGVRYLTGDVRAWLENEIASGARNGRRNRQKGEIGERELASRAIA
jgi:hypothetical protein